MNDPNFQQMMSSQGMMMQQPMSQMGGFGASMFSPMQYSNFATPYSGMMGGGMYMGMADVGMSGTMQPMQAPARTLMGSLWNNMFGTDPSRLSKEAQSEAMAQQTRMIQQGAMNAMSTAANGVAGVGSLMVPGGLLASMAVGTGVGLAVAGGTQLMVHGATTALNYEDTLRRKGYMFTTPNTSLSETGTVGFARGGNQDVAQFLRDLGPEKFMEDKDISQILNGALDNRLMRGTQDVASFKKKFTDLVDAVKQITVTMDQSLQDAMKFMGEMERRGISGPDQIRIAAQSKVAGSYTGMSASDAAAHTLSTVDSITYGTNMNAAGVATTANFNTILMGQLTDNAKTSNPSLYHYIMNSGGAAGVSATTEQFIRGYTSQHGELLNSLVGSAIQKDGSEPGKFKIDDSRMRDLLSGNYTTQQLQDKSAASRAGLSDVDSFALNQQASSLIQNYITPATEGQLMKLVTQQFKTSPNVDDATAFQMASPGMSREQADLLATYTKLSTNKDVQQSIGAQTWREATDSASISQSPSLMQRFQFGLHRVGMPLENLGQNVSDSIGNVAFDLNQWGNGYADRSQTNRTGKSVKMTTQGFQDAFGGTNAFKGYNYSDELTSPVNLKTLQGSGYENMSSFGQGDFHATMDMLNRGELSPSAVAQLQQRIDNQQNLPADQRLGADEVNRMRHVINQATGKYDGVHAISGAMDKGFINFLSGIDSAEASVGAGVASFAKAAGKNVLGFLGLPNFFDKTADDSKKGFKNQTDQLRSQFGSADKELMSVIAQGASALGTSNLDGLSQLIQSGKVDEVNSMTGGNAAAKDLANRYSGLLGQQSTLDANSGKFMQQLDFTDRAARSVDRMKGILTGSGATSKYQADQLFGQLTDVANKTLSGLKDGTISTADMVSADSKIFAGAGSIVSHLSPDQKTRLIDDIASHSDVNKADFYSNGQVDDKKLSQSLITNAAAMQGGSSAVGDLMSSASTGKIAQADKELKKTLDDHADSLSGLVSSLQKEIKTMNDAANGRPVTQSRTSPSTPVYGPSYP